jgi:hypothetical protein
MENFFKNKKNLYILGGIVFIIIIYFMFFKGGGVGPVGGIQKLSFPPDNGSVGVLKNRVSQNYLTVAPSGNTAYTTEKDKYLQYIY